MTPQYGKNCIFSIYDEGNDPIYSYLEVDNNKIINIFVWNGQGILPFPPSITVQEVTDPQTQTIGNYIFDAVLINAILSKSEFRKGSTSI